MLRLIVLAVLLSSPVLAQEGACTAGTPPGVTCGCDVQALRPLQGALGMEEVRDKVRRILEKPRRAWEDLADDPIKVVRGPGGALFITDHHHGADAWRLAGHPAALCRIVARPSFGTEAQFWAGLAADRLVRLADAAGRPVTPGQLPASLAAMPDDPYRTLAWRLRKEGGFCRAGLAQVEFVEFAWADWLRGRAELPAAVVQGSGAVPAALRLALSPAARGLPGYVGDKPAGFVCPREP